MLEGPHSPSSKSCIDAGSGESHGKRLAEGAADKGDGEHLFDRARVLSANIGDVAFPTCSESRRARSRRAGATPAAIALSAMSKRPRRRGRIEAELEALAPAVRDPSMPESQELLRDALQTSRSFVAAKATALVRDRLLSGFEADLKIVFERFLDEPVEADPGGQARGTGGLGLPR